AGAGQRVRQHHVHAEPVLRPLRQVGRLPRQAVRAAEYRQSGIGGLRHQGQVGEGQDRPMIKFVVARLGRGVLTVWFAVTVTFLMLRLLPGDPALALASTNMTEETRAAILSSYGLDQPLPVQYALYLGQLVQGNL